MYGTWPDSWPIVSRNLTRVMRVQVVNRGWVGYPNILPDLTQPNIHWPANLQINPDCMCCRQCYELWRKDFDIQPELLQAGITVWISHFSLTNQDNFQEVLNVCGWKLWTHWAGVCWTSYHISNSWFSGPKTIAMARYVVLRSATYLAIAA